LSETRNAPGDANPAVTPAFESKVEAKTPEWVKDAVFYQIFPDRFAKSDAVHKPSNLEKWDAPPTSHGYKGGDLLGIAENIDYLADWA
jgi:cyclomaltodextrinase / maltogenic alpha-amylase / neopullulanase